MKKTLYTPLIFSSLVLIGSVGLFGLEYYLLDTAQTQAMDLEKQVRDTKTEIQRASQAQNALELLGAREQTVREFSLQKSDIVKFLESLQATGKSFGSTIQVVSVSDEKQGGRSRISVSLLISGSFDAVMRTVGTFENGEHDSTLSNLTVTADGTTTKGPQRWSAATVLSVGVAPESTSTLKKP